MKYVDTGVDESDFTHKVDDWLKNEQETQRLRSEYMTYQMKLDERFEEGMFKTLYELVKDNLLSLKNAAKKAKQSEEDFAAGMDAYFAQAVT